MRHLGLGDLLSDLVGEPVGALSTVAARAATAATVPADTGVPNNSANARAVRSLDRNRPT
jgi:hypothetical protein